MIKVSIKIFFLIIIFLCSENAIVYVLKLQYYLIGRYRFVLNRILRNKK